MTFHYAYMNGLMVKVQLDITTNRTWMSLGLLEELEYSMRSPVGDFQPLHQIVQNSAGENRVIVGRLQCFNPTTNSLEDVYVIDDYDRYMIINI